MKRLAREKIFFNSGSLVGAEFNNRSLGERCIELLPGQYFDRETNTHYNYKRDYDPAQGRYNESDLIGLQGGTNTYAYVLNNPLRFSDSKGLNADPPAIPVPLPIPCSCPPVPPAPNGTSCPANINQAKQSFNPSWWYKQVQNGGPWDFKQQGGQYQNFGNFNFGATGAAFGIPTNILLRGAGWAQHEAGTSFPGWGNWYGSPPYGDDPIDQYYIQQGIQYYQCGCYK